MADTTQNAEIYGGQYLYENEVDSSGNTEMKPLSEVPEFNNDKNMAVLADRIVVDTGTADGYNDTDGDAITARLGKLPAGAKVIGGYIYYNIDSDTDIKELTIGNATDDDKYCTDISLDGSSSTTGAKADVIIPSAVYNGEEWQQDKYYNLSDIVSYLGKTYYRKANAGTDSAADENPADNDTDWTECTDSVVDDLGNEELQVRMVVDGSRITDDDQIFVTIYYVYQNR